MSDAAPSRDQMSAWLGIRAPAALVDVVAVAYEVMGSRERAEAALRNLLDGDLIVASERSWRAHWSEPYEGTPREFVRLIEFGVDGAQYGYFVRTSERGAEDWPVVYYCPMDDDPPILVGRTTREAVEMLISGVLASDEAEADPQLLSAVCARLGIEPAAEKADLMYGPDGNGIPVWGDAGKA